jgi:hypothetical protein
MEQSYADLLHHHSHVMLDYDVARRISETYSLQVRWERVPENASLHQFLKEGFVSEDSRKEFFAHLIVHEEHNPHAELRPRSIVNLEFHTPLL